MRQSISTKLVITVAAAVLPAGAALSGCGSPGHQAGRPPAASPPVVTVAGARQVFGGYAAMENHANKLRDASLLAAFEGGSSYQIDAGGYKAFLVTDPANNGYAAITFVNPQFFVPRQYSYPAWFVVRAEQQETQKPRRGKPRGSLANGLTFYLVFTKTSAGAKWTEVLEPNTGGLPVQAQPAAATDRQGYATALNPAQAGQLAVAPAALPAQDVAYLDAGSASALPPRPGLPTPTAAAHSAISFTNGKKAVGDLQDEAFFRKLMPGGSPLRDTHLTTPDQVFALRTADGGALALYDLRASLLIAAPFAQPFKLKYAGFINGKTQARTFTVNYLEQFAVYEPPGKKARPRIVANYSGPVSSECDGAPCK